MSDEHRMARLRLLRVGEQHRSLRSSQRVLRRRMALYVWWASQAGMSVREIHRLTGLSRDTITRMIIEKENEEET